MTSVFIGARGAEDPVPVEAVIFDEDVVIDQPAVVLDPRRDIQAERAAAGLIRRLRYRGIAVAVVSPSLWSHEALARAGIEPGVDVIVDGRDAAALDLPDKPDRVLLLEAARQLGVVPGRIAVVVGSTGGVDAAHRGGFGVVAALDRANLGPAFREHGADLVVADLGDLELFGTTAVAARPSTRYPTVVRWQ